MRFGNEDDDDDGSLSDDDSQVKSDDSSDEGLGADGSYYIPQERMNIFRKNRP